MELMGKRALVTGGAVRIGASICRALAADGCHVAIHYRSSGCAAEALQRELEGMGVRASVVVADLDDPDDVATLVGRASDSLGGLDILVNNAAVFHKHDLLETTPALLQGELQANALAPIALMRSFALQQRALGGTNDVAWPSARIVNVLDRRVASVERGAFSYALSKNMLRDATRMAARELGPGISVNAVAPGPILPPPGEGEAYLADRAGPMVLGARPEPEHIANAVRFLLQAEGITGQVIFVDSGQHLLGGI